MEYLVNKIPTDDDSKLIGLVHGEMMRFSPHTLTVADLQLTTDWTTSCFIPPSRASWPSWCVRAALLLNLRLRTGSSRLWATPRLIWRPHASHTTSRMTLVCCPASAEQTSSKRDLVRC